MTLCMAWKLRGVVHFASDSRLTFGNSYADVGIKVFSLPYQILSPSTDQDENPRSVAVSGELGMCFAGSTVNSLTIKESIVEVLKSLQYAPGYTDISMAGIAGFVFTAYKIISRRVCQTDLGHKGRADIIIGGLCPIENLVRVFLLSTDMQNNHSIIEILNEDNSYQFIGDGKRYAENEMPANPMDIDYLNVLKSAIDDQELVSVGGNIQYGEFRENKFAVFGVLEYGQKVHYWRGALDLNSEDFMADHTNFIPGLTYLDPFRTIGV